MTAVLTCSLKLEYSRKFDLLFFIIIIINIFYTKYSEEIFFTVQVWRKTLPGCWVVVDFSTLLLLNNS